MAKPKLALIPSTVGGSVYSVLPSNGDGDFDFTRASAATRINAQGLIETVAVGDNRLNYPLLDGTVQTCPHLLLEPQRTNLITYSEDFSNAYWVKASVSITSNSTISPDGTLNASLMTITGGTSDQRIFANIAYSGTNVVSVFAKASDSKWFSIRIGNNVNKWYDLENGVLGDSTLTVGYVDADIQDYGNGWYRCILVFTDNFTTSTRFYPAEGNLDVTQTSGSVYIWGAQSEASSSYPTSYIVSNSGSATTRIAEVCDGSGNASTFNSSEGVLMAQIGALADDGTFRLIGVSDGTSTNRIYVGYRNLSNQIQCAVSLGGVEQTIMFDTISDVQSSIKVLVKYKTNDFALWINGFEVATDTSGITFPANTLNTATFSSGAGSSQFYGKAKQVQYFDSALTDSELETLTSWMSFSDMAIDLNYTIQ
jgi:hypothetical protein